MSIQEERELRERLGGLLDGIETGPAPVATAVRRGAGIRMRRWVSAGVGVAVVIGAAGGIPAVLHSGRTLPPASKLRPYSVTVSAPGKGARPGVIATGSVDGKRWQATVSGTGADVAARFGARFPIMPVAPVENPAGFVSSGDGAGDLAYVGTVAAQVRDFTLLLANGKVIVLHPQVWQGQRYIAFVLPVGLGVSELAANGSGVVLSYAVPFSYRGEAIFNVWLRPDQPSLPRATGRIGSGVVGGQHWSAVAYAGIWGICVVVTTPPSGWTSGCSQVSTPVRALSLRQAFMFGSGPVDVGQARSDVAYLRLQMSGGSTVRTPVVSVDGTSYFAVANSAKRIVGWAAYSANGTLLGSGLGNPAA